MSSVMSLNAHGYSDPSCLPTMDDPQLVHFHRQYMQQLQTLIYPPGKLLLHPDVQDQVYRNFFDGPLRGPPAYQRKVLKKTIGLIEREIKDPEFDEVSAPLMEHISYLSTLLPSAPASLATTAAFHKAMTKEIIVYTLPFSLSIPHPPRILIEEAPGLLSAGSNVGHRTWEASLYLATFLCQKDEVVRRKRVLELGAGTGLVSILCAGPLDAEFVLSTDGLEGVVEGVQGNIARNKALFHKETHDTATIEGAESVSRRELNIVAKLLDWQWAMNDDLDELEEALTYNTEDRSHGGSEMAAFDVILGADITYSPDVVPVLARMLRVVMIDLRGEKTPVEAWISATVRNEETLRVFRESCVAEGLTVEPVPFDSGGIREQRGFFHEQGFPMILMKIFPRIDN